MPVPNILASLSTADIALFDANFAYLAALRDLFTLTGSRPGLSVTPSGDWDAGGTVLQFGPSSAIYNPGSQSHSVFASNLIYTSGAMSAKYINSAAAAAYNQDNGRHRFYRAVSGTSGATATLLEAMQIDNAGNFLLINPPSTPPALGANGDLAINPTSNTNLRFSYRGSDGVTRVGNIALA